MKNLIINYVPRYTGVDPQNAINNFTIPAGANGWISTDISASEVPSSARMVCVSAYHSGAAFRRAGSRRSGQTGSGFVMVTPSTPTVIGLCGVGSSRLIELYRDSDNDIIYSISGYLE